MLTLSGAGQPQNGVGIEGRFVISVKTDNAGTSLDNQFTLPWIGTYDINWGDGNTDTGVVNTQTHTYASPGTYDVAVTATTGRIYFNNSGDKFKITNILNWGSCSWVSMENAFKGCKNILTLGLNDVPDLSNVTNVNEMFRNINNQNGFVLDGGLLSQWDVSNINIFKYMFSEFSSFGNSDVINIDITNWNVSNGTDFTGMFFKFRENRSEQSIGNPSGWNTTNATSFNSMFNSASILNTNEWNFSGWNISNVTVMNNFLTRGTLSVANYDATLISWASQNPTSINVNFGSSQYSYEGAAARQTLIDTYDWTITDGGQTVSPEFVISVKTDNAGTSNDNQYTLGWIGTYDVDWGDGNNDLGVVDFQTHTYASPGTYEVKVKATTGRWAIGNGGDRDKNIDILNWGTCAWTSMAGTLNTWRGNKNITATDIPNLTQCTDMSSMFQRAHFETINLVGWDVSSVTNMQFMFRQVANFVAYDPIIDISGWDVSNCTNIRYMFSDFGKLGFTHNGYIGDISNWDTGNVIMMDAFANSEIIAGPNFTAANWDVSSVTNGIEIGITQTIENYDATLINFASQSPQSNLVCKFGANQYSYEAAAARQTLIDTYGWTITDGGQVASPEFVISVKTDNTGTSADNEFALPWIGTYDVDWGDGNKQTGVTDSQTHTYASAGTYDVKVTAVSGRINFNNGGDKTKLLDIKNWGTCEWVNLDRAFMGCNSLTDVTATDTPNFSNLIDLGLLFYAATSLTSIDVSSWDVSNVEQFDNMFVNCDITSLDVSNWNVSNAINLYDFVGGCILLTTLDVSNWNVGNCSNFKLMFRNCPLVNPDVSNWDISSMTGLRNMLSGADSFDRSLANWGVLPFANNEWGLFMNGADGLSTVNYDATLIAWAALIQTSNININFGGSQYSYEAVAARQSLIDTYGWTITDGGQAVAPEFALKWQTTTPNEEVQLGVGNGTFDYVIDWGDGTIESYNTDANISHIYADAGFHVTKITGIFPHYSNASLTWPFNDKLKEILNWGTISWESLNGAFRGARALTVSATDIPIFGSNTIDLATMFYDARGITNIPNIDQWDWSKVTAIASMFLGKGSYQEIATLVGNFNITSNLTNAASFMGGTNTFTSFAGWDVTGAAAGSWNGLFRLISATSKMSTEDYDATLISWAAQSVNNNVQCSFGISQYTPGGAAEAARSTLINTFGWTITDGGGAFVGLLDTYPNASAAYSLRDLASASVDSAVVRVRRSSDNTEQDFTSVEITDGTLATFCSGTDGFVAIWYDQSGNSNNASTPVALQQYLIVDNGVIYMSDGKPAIVNLNSNNKFLGWNEFTAVTVISVSKQVGAYGKLQCLFTRDYGTNTANERAIRRDDQSPYQNWTVVGNTQDWFVPANGDWYSNNVLKTADYTNPDTELLFLTNAGSQTYSISRIGDGGNTNRSIRSAIQEVIIYPTDQTANRTGIETNINNKYLIYPTSGLLADYPNASAAYSLRSLSNLTASVVRVRRSNDNTEQDFTATEITDGTLTTFTGANDGFVTTWYDQSGNGSNAVQATAANQPKLVSNGVVNLQEGKPSIYYDGTDNFEFAQVDTTDSISSVFAIVEQKENNNQNIVVSGKAFGEMQLRLTSDLFAYIKSYLSSVTSMPIPNNNQNVLLTSLATLQKVDIGLNGYLIAGDTPPNINENRQKIDAIGFAYGGDTFEGNMQEIIIYNTDQSLNKIGIETNMGNNYNLNIFPVVTGGFLSEYPGASAAYSLRGLLEFSTGYDINVVRVRRSSDNEERNFTATQITDGTLTTFTGINDGFVVTWYDQSDNSNHASQATAAKQAMLVENGVVNLYNGKPSINFERSLAQKYDLSSDINTVNTVSSIFSVVENKNDGFGDKVFISGQGVGTMQLRVDTTQTRFNYIKTQAAEIEFIDITLGQHLLTSFSKQQGVDLAVDGGSLQIGTTPPNLNSQKIDVIGWATSTSYFNGNIQELVIYDTDQSLNRNGIETNINTEYTIY